MVMIWLVYGALVIICFFFKDTATTEIYTYLHTLSLHDALPISGTAVLHEIAHESVHPRVVGRVDERAAVARLVYQSSPVELSQMKRERRVGYVQIGGDSAGWKTLSARAHQKLEQRQAMFLGECSERQDCLTGLQRTSPHFE